VGLDASPDGVHRTSTTRRTPVTITEQTRHDLLTACEHTLGKEAAMTLAELLPPVGWADVATKHDLHELERRLDLRFDAMDLRFEAMAGNTDLRFEALEHKVIGTIRKDITDSQRTLFFGIVSAIAANTAIVLTASRLFS